MLNCEIEILKNMTEKELYKYFSKYILGGIALFVIIGIYVILYVSELSFTARLFILILAFTIAAVIWTFNLLLARLHYKKKLKSKQIA